MAQRSLGHLYSHFQARTDVLLREFSVSSSHTPTLVEGITIDKMIEYTRRYLVNRLFHLWGEFCRSIVVASAIGGYSTLSGQIVTKAPTIQHRSDIPQAIRSNRIVGPGLRWEDPQWTSVRVDRLQLANAQQVKLGIGAAPFNQFRPVRHFVIHANSHTRAEFEAIANSYLLFDVEPNDLLLHRLSGGGTVLERWIREFQVSAYNAVL